jgi:hypothetical protein
MRDVGSGGFVRPSHCGEAGIRETFANGGEGQGDVNGFFQFATHNKLSFPDNLLAYTEVTTPSLNTSMSCNLPAISAAADTVALDLRVTLVKRNTFCLGSTEAPGNGHGYNSPERCAARCMCNVGFDQPSDVRHFSLYRRASSYACYCGTPTESQCSSSNHYSYADIDMYTFTAGGSTAVVSPAQFCAAGSHRVYMIPYVGVSSACPAIFAPIPRDGPQSQNQSRSRARPPPS